MTRVPTIVVTCETIVMTVTDEGATMTEIDTTIIGAPTTGATMIDVTMIGVMTIGDMATGGTEQIDFFFLSFFV